MMTDIITPVMQTISTSIMNFLIFSFLYKVYQCKYKNIPLYIISYLITTFIFVAVNRITAMTGIAVFNFFYGFFYIHLLCILLFEKDYKKTFMYNSLYIIALMFTDILTVVSLSIINCKSIVETTSNPQNSVINYCVYIFFMILIYFIFISILNKNDITEIKTKQIILLSLFTLFETFVVDSYAIEIENKTINSRIIVIIAGFLTLNISIVYFISKISKIYRNHYEYDLMKYQNQIQLEHYIEINQKYEETRKILHDIKKHISTQTAIRDFDENKSMEYESLIESKINSLFTKFHCTNNILSAIMSQKINISGNKNIKVKTQIEDILFDFIDDLDMTAIFANLWDNAIEACEMVDESERFISIIIGQVNDFIIICFENSFNGNINIKNGNIFSSKSKHDGLGISIIKSSIEKYSGSISFNYENNTFKAEALIPIQ